MENGEWTWEKFSEIANKLATGDGDIYGGLLYTWGMCNVMPVFQRNKPFITQEGEIDIDDSFIYSFRLRKELEESLAIFPLIELKATKTHYSKAFYSGKVGMLIIGAWFPPFMSKGRDEGLLEGFTWDDWGVTRVPNNEPEYATLGWSTLNHVAANSKNKEAAFKFVGWAGGPEGAQVVANAGLVPPNMGDPGVKAALGEYIPDEQSLEYFTETVTVNPPWYTKYGSRIQTLVGELMEVYLSEDMSDDELMDELRNGLDEIIKTTD
ncbi:MAG: hypothetical protein RQ801_00195 [Spirochaetaceae bacterium]|nr:hypothetical protein [Spirochaetaceae bacterium]